MKKLAMLSLVFIALIFTSCGDSAKKDNSSKKGNTTDLENAKLVGDEIINTTYGDIELQHTFMTKFTKAF